MNRGAAFTMFRARVDPPRQLPGAGAGVLTVTAPLYVVVDDEDDDDDDDDEEDDDGRGGRCDAGVLNTADALWRASPAPAWRLRLSPRPAWASSEWPSGVAGTTGVAGMRDPGMAGMRDPRLATGTAKAPPPLGRFSWLSPCFCFVRPAAGMLLVDRSRPCIVARWPTVVLRPSRPLRLGGSIGSAGSRRG